MKTIVTIAFAATLMCVVLLINWAKDRGVLVDWQKSQTVLKIQSQQTRAKTIACLAGQGINAPGRLQLNYPRRWFWASQNSELINAARRIRVTVDGGGSIEVKARVDRPLRPIERLRIEYCANPTASW